jgi:protoporphyrinogen IX oxidase
MMLELARVLHIFGVLLWVGGMVTGAAAGITLVGKADTEREAGLDAIRGALRILATPGLLLAWLGGLVMLMSAWSEVYARAGWMHGKLTIGIILSGLHGMLLARTRPGKPAASRPFVIVLAATLLLALANIALVVLRPGG